MVDESKEASPVHEDIARDCLEALDAVAAILLVARVGNRRYLLSTVNGRAAGIAKFRHAPCPVAGGDENAFELQQLYVLADMQGYGLGRRLVACLIEAAGKADANGVWLSAWEFADWATGFYRTVGFREIGKVEFSLGETTYTDLLMWMSLE